DAQTGGGIGGTVSVTPTYGAYDLNTFGFGTSGSGYAVGDTLTVFGANLGGTTPTNNLVVKVAAIDGSTGISALTFVSGQPSILYSNQASNWVPLIYTANEGAPVAAPANGTNWFYSVVDQVDIMVNSGGIWNGYKNVNYDTNGFPSPTGTNATDPAGPLVSPTEPTLQSDGTALVYGDIWINTGDLEVYPIISRWQLVNGDPTWVVLDNADQTSSQGVTFLDARWATNETTSPVDDPIPTITSLLTSDYLDLDAPDPALYPTGMLLFNTRRSGYNVKEYIVNYFNSASFPGDTLPVQTSAWVSASGLQSNGAPFMGRQAQRNMVVTALRSVVDTNTDIRDEDNFFNLMAAPYYPELQPNMVVLNADRGETGYIIGDTPMRLADDATAIQAWATNAAGATSTGEAGCVTRNTYLGLFYPSGIAPDLSGNLVAVPPSHMMLRTFLRSDTASYPWLAAAGTRRGTIDNATNIGYLDAATGEFITIKTRIGIRDVLYINFINPLVFFTGVGLLNYGNKTSFNSSSALDRVNVARLIAYIRRQLTLAARPFVFEPNDALTRQQIAGVVQTLMVDLVAKRGLYDYLVVCDESNNTPARIDRNELWIDVAVEPVKAAEFIYIPVRVLNTGEIASLNA
ncbi:MAG: phage tail sheath C-terminal domain-containing protein, partial [Candidatus Nanopelagicus sp.]